MEAEQNPYAAPNAPAASVVYVITSELALCAMFVFALVSAFYTDVAIQILDPIWQAARWLVLPLCFAIGFRLRWQGQGVAWLGLLGLIAGMSLYSLGHYGFEIVPWLLIVGLLSAVAYFLGILSAALYLWRSQPSHET